ncbi:flagellar hook-basal body complex protein [Microvirga tunisiensis]|uniref:Flagellar hook protein FlgE n=2 Tax=Pannonibacter tanglangensis TaxID=2750084 RepID=A0A7X5EZW3_9HYPH|nr:MULTISPECIES: flagellar hook-basal body complex protein [unclassified Pannonibacter]NBN63521.1 flagellar hook-basal body complex protein [Pannonibacter sp. XCT-34]NBN77158.1 flagellar hook-basal body complex protein [Pannonibacter sp. XCT-53]
MSIYGAINAATSGLAAQSKALENISGNVANSQTIGYKRLDTTFSDLVSSGGAVQGKQVAGTTLATSRATNTVSGAIVASQVDTYLAINGKGYFVVTEASDVIDGQTTFADAEYYTRAGDFELDENGFLVNSAGYYLKGYKLDPLTGNAVGDSATVIQVPNQPMAAKATSEIRYQANLPTYPLTKNANKTVPGSQFLDTSGAITATSNVTKADLQDFLDSSISGQAITGYDANGAPVNVEIRWAQTAANTWNAYYSAGRDATTAAATDVMWNLIGQVTFTPAGKMDTLTPRGTNTLAPGNTGFVIDDLTVGGVNAGDIQFTFKNDSLTQYADPKGLATSVSLKQDGYAAGQVIGVTIDAAGRVTASYSNQQQLAVYEIPIATFSAEHNLRRVDGAAFAATPLSGVPVFGEGGSVLSNSYEASNADIAAEFSKLIITQQAYSANSRVVTSADEMLSDALNMIR